jgi:hypothetical protein
MLFMKPTSAVVSIRQALSAQIQYLAIRIMKRTMCSAIPADLSAATIERHGKRSAEIDDENWI